MNASESGRWSKFIWSGFDAYALCECPSPDRLRPLPNPSPRAGEGRVGARRREGHSAMIGRLNHVAIVVPDVAEASATYRQVLGTRVSEQCPLPAHGVTAVFVELPNAKIELLEPLGATSPVKAFLERNPAGGMHHICYEVDDIIEIGRASCRERV